MQALEGVKIDGEWLRQEPLQRLFDILCADGGEARVAGGAVRNALMGEAIADVDLCTTLVPKTVMERLDAAGEKAVPTGFDHGTITAVIGGVPFEVTTLRRDVKTDGRHAVVEFGTDWQADALRRDLTINGLYCDRDGRIFDFVGGYGDVIEKQVRFIGEAETRIREDSLRILRFFRFFAWYGEGRPDAEGLKACNAGKKLLSGLSAERVWMELKKLLSAPDPGRALLWMRTTGILGGLVPESVKWGIDAIPGLIRLEQEQGWQPDPMLRLMAMVRPDLENMQGLAKRLNLSNRENEQLELWVRNAAPKPGIEMAEFEKLLYRSSPSGLRDAMKLEVVHLRNREEDEAANQMSALIEHAESWQRPMFPLKGRDLLDLGFEAGPGVGEKLSRLEEAWIESGFRLGKAELLKTLN